MDDLAAYDWFGGTEQGRLITLPTSSLVAGMPPLPPLQQRREVLHSLSSS